MPPVASGAEERLRRENADLRSAHAVLLRGVETLKAEVVSLKVSAFARFQASRPDALCPRIKIAQTASPRLVF